MIVLVDRHRQQLFEWIRGNWPSLHNDLALKTLDEVRERLTWITGVELAPSSTFESTVPKLIQRLEEAKREAEADAFFD